MCLSSGEGHNAVFLASQGFEVLALDYSKIGLEKTKILAEKQVVTLTTEYADLNNYSPKLDEYDAILAVFLHLGPHSRKQLAQKISPSLKVGGVFLAEYYHEEQANYDTGGPKNKDFLLSSDKIKEEFLGLRFTLLEKKKKIIIEGSGHTGECVVLDVIAKK